MKAINMVLIMHLVSAGVGSEIMTFNPVQQQGSKKPGASALCTQTNYDRYINHRHGLFFGQPIGVEVELPQYRFVVGEPIVVRATITNQTHVPISMDVYEGYFLRIYLSQDGENFYEYQAVTVTGPSKPLRKTLNPNESWKYEKTVLYCPSSMDHLVIREAGKYYLFVDVIVDLAAGRIYDSGVVSFQVEEPRGDDAEVLRLLRGEDGTYKYYGYFIGGEYSGGMELIRMVERFDRLIQQYPGSAYASALRSGMRRFLERMAPGTRPEMIELFGRLRAQYLESLPEKRP